MMSLVDLASLRDFYLELYSVVDEGSRSVPFSAPLATGKRCFSACVEQPWAALSDMQHLGPIMVFISNL